MAERAHPELFGFSEGSLYREHLFKRYAFANKHASGKIVLDIPCGVGWGTSLLNAKHTIGMDISKDAIAYGKNKYPGIDFLVGNMVNMSLTDKSIEIIVCLEGFEHIKKNDSHRFLNEVERILVDDGKIVLTCPVILPGEKHTGNPYHLYEPTIEEFNKIINERFEVDQIEIIKGPESHIAYFVGKKHTAPDIKYKINDKLFSSCKKNVLLTTSAAPSNTPFSTTEKRPPIGIGYLISILRNEGHKVFFIDNYLKPSNFLENNYLLENEIDIVGIYTNTICFRDTLRMLYRLEDMRLSKKWNGKIVVGGPHASVAPETIPNFVDHVVIGEGEYALRDIVAGKVKDRVVKYPPIEDLDLLPMPAWEDFAKLPYDWNGAWLPEGPVFTMNTSRGCPFNCSFCSVGSIWGKRYTYHSAERIISEIEYLIEYHGAKGIYFREDNFTLNKKRLRKFCDIITKKQINIPWVCETRASNLNHEIVQMMASAGAKGFYIGVESGSQKILDFLNKNIKLKDIRSAFRLCKEFKINTAASIIVGVPHETEQDIQLTINLLNEIKPTVIWFNVFVGIPNSNLYQYIVESKQYEFIDDRGLVYLENHNKRVKRWYGNTWDASVPIKILNKCIVEPKVSVIMAVHNGEKHLKEAILSIIGQTFNNYELIIVNDGSTDNTSNILSNLNDPRIVILTNTENIGLTKSLNRAIECCKGEYIARMDADDLSHPFRLEKQIKYLDKHSEVVLIGSSYYSIDENGRRTKHIKVHTDSAKLKIALKEQNWFAHGSVMMRKSNVLKVGGYDENFLYAQDYDLWLKLSEKYEVANIEEPLYFWRSTEDTITQKKSKEQKNFADLAKRRAKARTQKPKTKYLSINHVKSTLVSVIVPTYNRPLLLLQALKSIHKQTFNDYEIIVINDGGISVENVLEELNVRSNINYISHSYNRGLAAARNTGIKIARGKYIAYLDDDDIYYPEHLSTLFEHLENNDYKVAYTDAYRSHKSYKNKECVEVKKDLPFSNDFDCDRMLVSNYIPVLCFMHEKSCLEKIGYFDEKLSSHEDWDLWIRMSQKYNFLHIKKITAEFSWLTDGSTMTSGKRDDMLLTFKAVYHKHADLVAEKPHIAKIQRENTKILEKQIKNKNNNKKCSIIIPVYNKIELTRNCLEALFNNTPVDIIEVIIVDNNSTDGTNEYLSLISEKVKVIKNKENLGFAIACNQGAKNSIGEYLVFLNNDTEVQSDWLNPLCEIIEQDKSVAAVGSKMLFPDNKIQHAGVVIINDQKIPDPLVARHIYYRQDCNYHMANVMSTYQALTAACMLIRKSSFKAVGGFDEKYWNGYEDIDLCFKLQKIGSFLIYQPNSVVIHYESQSGPERFKHTQHNIERLHKKWIGKINPDLIITPNGKIIETGSGFIRPYQSKKSVSPKFIDSAVLNKNSTSIIILTYNQIEFTKRCLESIFKNTSGLFELIIVDNGSTDGTIEYLESQIFNKCNDVIIKIIKNNENKGFAGGNNQGIVASSGEYILLLNNDVVVTPGWLERMIRCCEKRPKIGIVGPRSNYVSGLQCVESVDYNLDSLEGLNRFSEEFTNKDSKKSTRLLRVVGFCMLIKRSVIDKIGGMDDRYGIGNFEDDDFSLRAALAGFESWMAEDCFVHHFGSRTFIGEKIDYRKSLHKNWNIFKDKWGLPTDLPYGSPYSISQMKVNKFNPQVHYIPISVNNEKPVQNWIEDVATVEQEYITVCSSFDKENLEIAIEKLQEFADKYKDFSKVYNDLGVFYYQTGNIESALKHYRKALNLDQDNISFRKNLADLLAVAFGEYEEALQHYVSVLASDPKDSEALLATGHICARLERYDDAAEFYEKVLDIEPNNSDAANWLSKIQKRRSGNCLEGSLNDRYLILLSEIDQADLAVAIQKIENFIEMYPKHGQAHNDLGVLYYKKETKTKVLAYYLKAVDLEPGNVTFRKNLADFLYVEEGRVEEALENYVEVLRIKPDDVETLLITGHICTAIERFDDAKSFYHKVLTMEPKNLDARQNIKALKKRQKSMLNQEAMDENKTNEDTEIKQVEPHAPVDEVPIEQDGAVEELINKADLLFQQERIDQAVDTMLKAIAVNPSDGRTYVELAGQLVNHGRHENALEVLAEMPTNQPVAVVMQKMLVEGYAEEGMGNYAAAKKCSDGVLARDPKDGKALNLNGILSYRNGDKETAEQHFKRAIELDSEYGEPHTNLGALVWETNEPKLAMSHYENGFSLSPTDIEVANAYHEAVSANGEYKRAEKAARGALKKYPQCRKIRYLLIDTLIKQKKNEEALKELETALSTFGIDEGLLDTALAFSERVGKIKKNGSSKKSTVSLCMIVKDEEANLARCLASVKPIVDEMVVVDTGSNDRTRDIAEFFGARVYEFEWSNDFAAARNFSISKAKGDWILIMDADEVISPMDYDHFRKLTVKKSQEPVAYSVATRNYCHEANTIGWYPNDGHYVQEEAGFGWLLSEKVRLFSNRRKIKFEGAVHEMVDPVLKRIGIKIKKSAIPVHHYGRLNTDLLNKKRRIYYEIGQKKLAENGSSIGAVRELAIQATALEKNSEAIKLWTKFLSMKPDNRSVPEAYVNMGSAYIRMKDYEKALISAQKAVAIRPEMKEAQYNLGMAELYNGNADAAVMTLKKLIKSYPNFPPAQFLFSASNCCKNDSPDRNGELKALKRSYFGRVLTYSVAELAEGLMSADQHKLAQKLLLHAIEEEIVSKDIMNLYAACIKKNEDSRNLGGKIPEEADVLQETIVE